MKWNWGYGIATLYIGFVLMMVSLVVMSMGRKVDLVTDKYYDEEVKFDSKLAKMKRSNALTESVSWLVNDEGIVIQFPTDLQGAPTGQVQLYCPANSDQDRSFAIQSLDNNTLTIPRQSLEKGRYQLQIDWSMGGVEFWNQGVIAIN